VSGQLHAPSALPPERVPGTHFMDPRAGLDDMEKWQFFTLPGLELPLPWSSSRYTDWAIPAAYRRIVGCLINKELEKMWKEAFVVRL
jgi:hypothetical protein